jgi:hypothetical protein
LAIYIQTNIAVQWLVLLLCILEGWVQISTQRLDIRFVWFFSVLPGKGKDQTLKLIVTTYFSLSNSSFTNHPTVFDAI